MNKVDFLSKVQTLVKNSRITPRSNLIHSYIENSIRNKHVL